MNNPFVNLTNQYGSKFYLNMEHVVCISEAKGIGTSGSTILLDSTDTSNLKALRVQETPEEILGLLPLS